MFGGIESTALLPAVLGSSNIKPTPAAKFADKALIAVRKLKLKLLEDLVLRVDACGLTSLPAAILLKLKLRELHLSRNTLISLPPGVGALVHLRVLKLDHNLLVSIPAELAQLSHLQTLDCCSNLLESVPLELGLLLELTMFNLFENPLTALLKPSVSGFPDSACIPDPLATPRTRVRGARLSGSSVSRLTPDPDVMGSDMGEERVSDPSGGEGRGGGVSSGAGTRSSGPSPTEAETSTSISSGSSAYSAVTVTVTLRTFESAYYGQLCCGGKRPKLVGSTLKAQLRRHTGMVLAALRGCMPKEQGKGVREAVGRHVAVVGREKLMRFAGVGELAVVERAVAAALAANVQKQDMEVAVQAVELLQDMKNATAGADSRRLRTSIETWEAFAAPLSRRLTGVDHTLAKSALRRLRRIDLSKGWKLTEGAYATLPTPAAEAAAAAVAAASAALAAQATAEADSAAAAAAADAATAEAEAEDAAAAAAWEERRSNSPNSRTPPLLSLAYTGCSVSGRHDAWGVLWEGMEREAAPDRTRSAPGYRRGAMMSDGVVYRRGGGQQGEMALRSYNKWIEEKRALEAIKKAELAAFQARLKEAERMEKLMRGQDNERIRYLEQGWPSRYTCPYKHGTFTDPGRLEYTRQMVPRPDSALLMGSQMSRAQTATPSSGRPSTAMSYRQGDGPPSFSARTPPRYLPPSPSPSPPLGHTFGQPKNSRTRATTAPASRSSLANRSDVNSPVMMMSPDYGSMRPMTSAGSRPRPGSLIIPTESRTPHNAVGLDGTARPPVSRSNGSSGAQQYHTGGAAGPSPLRPGFGSQSAWGPPLESVAESGTGESPTAWGAMPSPQSAMPDPSSRRSHMAEYGASFSGPSDAGRGSYGHNSYAVQSTASMDGRPTTSHQGGGSRGAVAYQGSSTSLPPPGSNVTSELRGISESAAVASTEGWGRRRVMEGSVAAAAVLETSQNAIKLEVFRSIKAGTAEGNAAALAAAIAAAESASAASVDLAAAAIAAAVVAMSAALPRSAPGSPRAFGSPRGEMSRGDSSPPSDFSPRSEATPRATGFLPFDRENAASPVPRAVSRSAGGAVSARHSERGSNSGAHPDPYSTASGSTESATATASAVASTAKLSASYSSDRSVQQSASPAASPVASSQDGTTSHKSHTAPPSVAASVTPEYSIDDTASAHASAVASIVTAGSIYGEQAPSATSPTPEYSVDDTASVAASFVTADSVHGDRPATAVTPTADPSMYSVDEDAATVISSQPSATARGSIDGTRTITPSVPPSMTPEYSVDDLHNATGSIATSGSIAAAASGSVATSRGAAAVHESRDGTPVASDSIAASAAPDYSVDENEMGTVLSSQPSIAANGSVGGMSAGAAVDSHIASTATPEYSVDDNDAASSIQASIPAHESSHGGGAVTEVEGSEEEEVGADDGVSEGSDGDDVAVGEEVGSEQDEFLEEDHHPTAGKIGVHREGEEADGYSGGEIDD